MRNFIKARVRFMTGGGYLGLADTINADVHINGGAAVINAPDKDHPENGMQRVDRLTNISVSTGGTGRDAYTEVTGRSEYMRSIGVHPQDQSVTIRVKGGKCLTCK